MKNILTKIKHKTNSNMTILNAVKIERGMLTYTDLVYSVCIPVRHHSDPFLFDFKSARKIISKSEDGSLSPLFKNKSITCENQTFKSEFEEESIEDFPLDIPANSYQTTVAMEKDDLEKCLSHVIPAVSKDTTRPHINNVHMNFGRIESTSGYVAYTAKMKKENSVYGKFSMPKQVAEIVVDMCKKTISKHIYFFANTNIIQFYCHDLGSVQFNRNMVNEGFPDLDEAIKLDEKNAANKISFSSKSIIDFIDKMDFKTIYDKELLLRSVNGKLQLCNTRCNMIAEKSATMGDFLVAINPLYLKKALPKNDYIFIYFNEALGPIHVKRDQFLDVIMLMRADKESEKIGMEYVK